MSIFFLLLREHIFFENVYKITYKHYIFQHTDGFYIINSEVSCGWEVYTENIIFASYIIFMKY